MNYEMREGSNIINSIKNEKNQFIVLTKHFFKRFFENEDISLESNAKQKLRTILVLLGILGGYLAHTLLYPYLSSHDKSASWVEKCYFVTFFMIIMGILSILQWKTISLDLSDYDNLALLPIKARTLFLSKFLSLLGLMSIFFLSTTIVSSFLFPIYLLNADKLNVLSFLRFSGAHLVSCFLAYFFVFIACGLLGGVLMLTLSTSFYQKFSTYIQIFLLIIFSFVMVLFVTFFNLYPEIYSSFPSLLENNSEMLYVLPSFWFVGLYESFLGNHDMLFNSSARFAILGTILVGVLYLWIGLLNYKKFNSKQEVRTKTAKSLQRDNCFIKIFNIVFLKDPVQRAVFYYFLITLKRIKKYKLMLGAYEAIAFSLFLVLLMTFGFKLTHEDFLLHEKLVLSLPHVMTVFLLIGARVISSFPESLEANWIFKLTEKSGTDDYLTGLKKGIFFLIILPSFLLLFVFYLLLLPLKDASFYSLYGLINSLILIGVVFFNYSKIPFTCTYKAKKINANMIWLIIASLSYSYAASVFGYQLLKRPDLFRFYIALVALIFIVFRILRKYVYKKNAKLLYEESLEFSGLDLE